MFRRTDISNSVSQLLKRVVFSWATTQTGAVKLTTSKAIDHLKSKFTQSKVISSDIQAIEMLPKTTVIVIKRPLAPHLRANLSWSTAIEKKVG